MPQVCCYFQLHQPYRLGDFSVFDLSKGTSYFSATNDLNKDIFQKVMTKSYLPMLRLLYELVKQHPEFVFAISVSGVFLEQAEAFGPEVITLLKKLLSTHQVELLTETYYHSLASLYSSDEFSAQVELHQQKTAELFSLRPKVFRNTELVYSNEIAQAVAELGFKGILTEAVPRYLGSRPKTELYRSFSDRPIPVMLKHAELSDDIAFRFSDRNWSHYPLHSDQYLRWLDDYYDNELINLFMDFETFGEHQWEDTGIFEFFKVIVKSLVASKKAQFIAPSQVIAPMAHPQRVKQLPIYDVPEPISWADVDRDLSAWIENAYQQDALKKIYSLEKKVLNSGDSQLITDWRRLQTSDHFYYMCTKWAADGDVHAYFSPYEDPHEAYRRYSIVLADLIGRMR